MLLNENIVYSMVVHYSPPGMLYVARHVWPFLPAPPEGQCRRSALLNAGHAFDDWSFSENPTWTWGLKQLDEHGYRHAMQHSDEEYRSQLTWTTLYNAIERGDIRLFRTCCDCTVRPITVNTVLLAAAVQSGHKASVQAVREWTDFPWKSTHFGYASYMVTQQREQAPTFDPAFLAWAHASGNITLSRHAALACMDAAWLADHHTYMTHKWDASDLCSVLGNPDHAAIVREAHDRRLFDTHMLKGPAICRHRKAHPASIQQQWEANRQHWIGLIYTPKPRRKRPADPAWTPARNGSRRRS